MQEKEFFIDSDGIRLHAKLRTPDSHPEKYPLAVIIHGFTGHMEETHILAVTQAIDELGFATLRVEMYGHGQSDGEFRKHTLYKWLTNAMDIVDYAKGLDFVSDLYLCGHSQGGLTTMLTAGLKPDDFKAIIPLSPASSILTGARAGDVLGMTFDPDHVPENISYPKKDLVLGGNYVRAAQTLYVEDAIRRYHGPVLLVHGDADEEVPVQCSLDAAKEYENAKLVIIPGDTHCYDNHLEKVTTAVKDFLKGL